MSQRYYDHKKCLKDLKNLHILHSLPENSAEDLGSRRERC